MKRPPYFAQFDGEEINGKRYALGDEIDADVPGAILEILSQQGRISGNKPTSITAPLAGSDKAIEDMSRAELEGSALSIMSSKILAADDDKLRETIERHRDELAAEDKSGAGEAGAKDPADDATKPKALSAMTTDELKATAEAESVTFGDDVKTNPDRVKAIQAARDAKAA